MKHITVLPTYELLAIKFRRRRTGETGKMKVIRKVMAGMEEVERIFLSLYEHPDSPNRLNRQ